MNKKRIALLLALMLLTSVFLVACGGDKPAEKPADDTATEEKADDTATEAPAEEGVENVEKFADAETLVVGAPELNADYINGFGNSTYDVWIKRMIGNYGGDLGYATTYYDAAGEFHVNPTVVDGDYTTTENADGSKTFTFKIQEDLKWNDGTPITAKDYVFGTLFVASPQWLLTGASNATTAEDLVGFEAYHNGESQEFPGIKLIDDYTFAITLKAEKVPYFYEMALISATPTPLHVYAKNVDVVGSSLAVAEGYEITEEDKANVIAAQEANVKKAQATYDEELKSYKDATDEYPQFNEEGMKAYEALTADYEKALADENTDPEYKYMLEKYKTLKEAEAILAGYKDGSVELSPLETLMTAAADYVSNDYRFKPVVTCGPYQFVEYANNMAKVTINPNFKGTAEGAKPQIKNVVVQTINPKLDVDLAIAGTIDYVSGQIEGAKIDKAKGNDAVNEVSYSRNGYGLMQILNHMGATKYKGVRQAIAYSLDRNEFVQTIAGGYGTVVNGAYGVAQFEYQAKGAEFLDKAINYTRNAGLANAALDTTPYTFEADGKTPWDAKKAEEMFNSNKEGFDYWRYDAEGNILRVVHQGSTNNEVSELISSQLPDNTKLIGMQYIVNPVDFATLLDNFYFPDETDKDAPTVFNMGTGFSIPNDPYYAYHSSQIGTGDNRNHVNDPELDKLLESMRRVDSSNVDAWNEGWLAFQLWFNDNLPNIPLYANEYYDIFTSRVQGVETTPMHDWSDIICDLTLAN